MERACLHVRGFQEFASLSPAHLAVQADVYISGALHFMGKWRDFRRKF